MFEINNYYGVYEDKNKKYIAAIFPSKEETIKTLDESEIVHELNIICPLVFFYNNDRTKYNSYFKGRDMYFLSIIINPKLMIIQEIRTDNKQNMIRYIEAYLKNIIFNEDLILGFRHVKDDIMTDLELVTNKNGFEKIYQIIEKR